MVRNSEPHKKKIKKGLYIASTPIGNLGDITLRTIDILKNSDIILCEDIRVSRTLLAKYEIKAKLISNHKFNEKKNVSKILQLLNDGLIVSLISDAGTPTISDPGSILINECIKHNINIIPLPGPTSISTAISISGFSEKFFFYGFFPEKKKFLEEDLEVLSKINSSIIFFVSPKKINKIIPLIKKNFSNRKILICREMSKYYEEFIRSEINEVEKFNPEPKGELTIVISEKRLTKKDSQTFSESDKRTIDMLINKLSIKDIVSLIYENSKISKKKIYDYCLNLKNEN